MAYRKHYPPANSPPKKQWRNYTKKDEVIKGSKYKPLLTPSDEQMKVFDHIENSNNHLVVNSFAGCAKTSTAVESMYRLKRNGDHKSIKYVIFGNRNKEEAKGKCHPDVNVSTSHAMGFQGIRNTFGKVDVAPPGEKAENIAVALFGGEDEKIELRYSFAKTMSLAKGFLFETPEEIVNLYDKYEIDIGEEEPVAFANKVLEGMEISLKQYNRIDFDDMIYIAVKKDVRLEQFDLVYADEVQDNSTARAILTKRSIKNGGKLIALGDHHQQLYSWTGVNESVMQDFVDTLTADQLRLTKTFRCGKKIVELAQTVVPDFQAAETNSEGMIDEWAADKMVEEAIEGDVILSRVNAPLVKYCLGFIKAGKRATVLGKDLGLNMLYMIKRSEASTVNQFLDWVSAWKTSECERLLAKKKSCEHIEDKADCLEALCEGRYDLNDVRKHIKDMFCSEESPEADDKSRIRLSTIHKFKGMESDRVFLFRKGLKPEKSFEEQCVYYVGITRARDHLVFVS